LPECQSNVSTTSSFGLTNPKEGKKCQENF
jgi:hypothetical protein